MGNLGVEIVEKVVDGHFVVVGARIVVDDGEDWP